MMKSHDEFDARVRRELILARDAVRAQAEKFRRDFEAITNCTVEEVQDKPAVLSELLKSPDRRVRALTFCCAAEFLTPNIISLSILLTYCFDSDSKISYLAMSCIGQWYERTGIPFYREVLIEIKTYYGTSSIQAVVVDFLLKVELPLEEISRIDEIFSETND